jgi:hypothetical protein
MDNKCNVNHPFQVLTTMLHTPECVVPYVVFYSNEIVEVEVELQVKWFRRTGKKQ